MKARKMRIAMLAAAGVALLGATTVPAVAFGLTEADYAYLAGRDVGRTSAVLRGLSPREQARLHAVINDAATAGDEAARANAVTRALEEFRERQAWEATHPEEMLNVRRR
jgi:hypothetical protein